MDVQTMYFHTYAIYCTVNSQKLVKRYFADVKSVQIHDRPKNFKNSMAKGRDRKNITLITLINELKIYMSYETLIQNVFITFHEPILILLESNVANCL